MAKKVKISSTAYRVLLLMQLLNDKNYSIENLNSIFSHDPYIARTFTKEVILKYLNTIRSAGYTIPKPNCANNYTYRLEKAPITVSLNEEEIETLATLENHVMGLYQCRMEKNFNNIIEKISRFLPEKEVSLLNEKRNENKNNFQQLHSRYEQYSHLIKKFEQYCIEDQRVIVKYKFPLDEEEKQLILEPKSIKYDSNDVYISGYNSITREKQLLHLNNILDIKQLPEKSKFNYVLSPIIFKLKGRVAKGYRLYEDEKIAGEDLEAGTITIAAYVDDKNMLLQRLLKYGDFCEVLYPKFLRDQIVKMVKNALKNYQNT